MRLPFVIAAALALAACTPPTEDVRLPAPDAGTPALRHRTGTFAGVGGVTLFEQSWSPAGPSKAVLVVQHGLKDHGGRYADLAAFLAKDGFATYAYDLRGHGRSAGERVDVERFDDYVSDLATYVEKVRAGEPNKPLFVLGHSMGGAIVTLYALDRHPAISGVVLSAPALAQDAPAVKVGATHAIAALSPRAGVFNLDLDDFSRDPRVVADGKSDPLVYQGGAPAETAVELLGAIDRIQHRMEEMTYPVLDLHGTKDHVTVPQGSRDLIARARSTDKTLKLYDGLVHDLLHEPERAQVMADIQGWLDARLTPPKASP